MRGKLVSHYGKTVCPAPKSPFPGRYPSPATLVTVDRPVGGKFLSFQTHVPPSRHVVQSAALSQWCLTQDQRWEELLCSFPSGVPGVRLKLDFSWGHVCAWLFSCPACSQLLSPEAPINDMHENIPAPGSFRKSHPMGCWVWRGALRNSVVLSSISTSLVMEQERAPIETIV